MLYCRLCSFMQSMRHTLRSQNMDKEIIESRLSQGGLYLFEGLCKTPNFFKW